LFQLTGRTVIMALFVAQFGALAIPAALAVTATLETLMLGSVLLVKLRQRTRVAPRLGESAT
jgi:hypothetical protein